MKFVECAYHFRNNNLVIVTRDFKDFKKFKDFCKKMGLLDKLIVAKDRNNYNWWRNIALINGSKNYYAPIIFEYSEYYNGFTFDTSLTRAIDWYGKDYVVNINDVELD